MRPAALLALFLVAAGLGACTGLVAGPEVQASTPIPASRDSAYARTRRALQAESFTLDVVDSTKGHLTGTRYAATDAKLGTAARCRVAMALDVRGTAQDAEVATTTRWVAPGAMSDSAPAVCERERADVLERIDQVLVPPAE